MSVKTKMERSKLNITHENGMINIILCDREKTRVKKIYSGPGQGISTVSKTTDRPCVSPLGDHTTRKKLQG